MRSHRTIENKCPICRSLLDSVTGVDTDEQPEPGDYSICGYCGSPLIFEEDLTVKAIKIIELPLDIRDMMKRLSFSIKLMNQSYKNVN
jgi:hypothetical protein